MNIRKLLSWLALALGVAVIIGGFFLFMKDAPKNVFVLNLSVALVIYALFFVDVLLPWVDWSDKSKSRIGSLGLRWAATWLYAILAIITIVLCNCVYRAEFPIQLLIHGALLLLLLLGMSSALHASAKVASVHQQEAHIQMGVEDMRRAVNELQQAMCDIPNVPDMVRNKIGQIAEDLRYISPSDNPDAASVEKQFSQVVRAICLDLHSNAANFDKIMTALDKASFLLKTRKSTYSL